MAPITFKSSTPSSSLSLSHESLPSAVCHDMVLGQVGHSHQSHLRKWSVDEGSDAAVVVIMALKSQSLPAFTTSLYQRWSRSSSLGRGGCLPREYWGGESWNIPEMSRDRFHTSCMIHPRQILTFMTRFFSTTATLMFKTELTYLPPQCYFFFLILQLPALLNNI